MPLSFIVTSFRSDGRRSGTLSRIPWVVPLLIALLWPIGSPKTVAESSTATAPRSAWIEALRDHEKKKTAGPPVWIQLPRDGASYMGENVRIAGCTEPGNEVTVNGEPLPTFSTGAFAGVVRLDRGWNALRFEVRDGSSVAKRRLRVRGYGVVGPLPAHPLQIGAYRPTEPDRDCILPPGERVRVRFQGAPGCLAWFRIGSDERRRPMRELMPGSDGVAFKGVYEGYYEAAPGDHFEEAPVAFFLARPGSQQHKFATFEATGKISTAPWGTTRVARILHNDTPLYEARDGWWRLTTVDRGARVAVCGRVGSRFRVRLGERGGAWVPGGSIRFLVPRDESPVDQAEKVRARFDGVTLTRDSEKGASVLTVKVRPPDGDAEGFSLPARAESLDGGSTLTLTVWGLDDAPEVALDYAASSVPEPWRALQQDLKADPLIDRIRIARTDLETATFELGLASRRVWGFSQSFNDGALNLRISDPPVLAQSDLAPLKGLRVILDAGHGGEDRGAIGAAGLCESDINIAIVRRLASMLRQGGAEVELTREAGQTVSLRRRSDIIDESDAHLLLSIHNNSISEYSNPFEHRGPRVFRRYAFQKPLAETLLRNIAVQTKIPFESENVRRHRFYLLRHHPEKAGALIECMFLSNPEDEAKLLDPAFLDTFCRGIYNGVVEYSNTSGLSGSARKMEEEDGRREAANTTSDKTDDELPHKEAVPMKRFPG